MLLAGAITLIFFTFILFIVILKDVCETIIESTRRKRLEQRTKYARIVYISGVVISKRYHSGYHDVTVRSKTTVLTVDDEDAYYVCRIGEEVIIQVREHIDKDNKIFHRVPNRVVKSTP